MMNIKQIEYFISVASYRNFTRAAECHFLTQTAITQQIRALEESLGTVLIDRRRRPVELTPAGKIFYQEAKAIMARVEEAVAKTQEASSGAVGTIRIGYEKGFERSKLSDCLREFHRNYPNILFTCIRESTDRLAQMLIANELDVIFTWDGTNLKENPEVDTKLVLRSRLTAALYAGHPLSFKNTLKREDLRDETLLYLSPSSAGDSLGDVFFLNLYEKAGYRPKILLKTSDIESVLIMVAAEEGISIMPSYCVEKLINADHLVFVPMNGEEEYEEVLMMWKKNHGNPALDSFLDLQTSLWEDRQTLNRMKGNRKTLSEEA